jgi:hypothetical protein
VVSQRACFLRKKVGSRGRYISPNQVDKLNQVNPLNPLHQVNQVNKEIEMVSISKEAQIFFLAFGPMHFYRPLCAAAALQREIKLWCWCSRKRNYFLV